MRNDAKSAQLPGACSQVFKATAKTKEELRLSQQREMSDAGPFAA